MENNDNIKRALHPSRFPGMSTRMMAIIGFIIEGKYTTPSIKQMIVTSDGILMARVDGDIGFNDILGNAIDFKKNWDKLIHIPNLGLTLDEIKYLEMLPDVTISGYIEWRGKYAGSF